MDGTYASAAIFCEAVTIDSENGKLQITNVHSDVVLFFSEAPNQPLLRPRTFEVRLAIGIVRAGAIPQDIHVELRQVEPFPLSIAEKTERFLDAMTTFTTLRAALPFDREGMHWYDLHVNGEVLARTALLCRFESFPDEKTG
jgi:hypothetical protein